MKSVSIDLYSFAELSEKAKQKAIEDHAEFMESLPVECENEAGEMEQIYETYSREDIIDNIEANDYIFFKDGELAHCTTYTDKHPKTGITIFHFHGTDYDITHL